MPSSYTLALSSKGEVTPFIHTLALSSQGEVTPHTHNHCYSSIMHSYDPNA